MVTDSNEKERARALFDAAVDEYFAEQSEDVAELERVYRWIHKSLELDATLADEQHVINFMSNLCALLGWRCADEGLAERSSIYYEEAIKFLEQLEDRCWHEYWYLGKALQAMGRLDDSLHAFEMALELAVPDNPRGHDPSNDELAALWADVADLYVALERPNDCIESLEWALLYAPDDEEIRGSLVLQCLFAGRFDRAIELSRSMLDSGCENRGLFLEYLATAAILGDDIDTANRTYGQLLEMAKNPEAREWYSRMLGYVEGLKHSAAGERIWEQEDWQWQLHGGGEGEIEVTSLTGMAETLREEIRDSTGKVSLQVMQLRQEMEHLPGLEREQTRKRLEGDVFGDLWGTLYRATQSALIEAELQVSEAEIRKRDDYSSAATMYQKALEIEIRRRLLTPFQHFLGSRGGESWMIGTEQYHLRRLQALDLPKVRDLLRGWRLVRNKPKSISTEDLRLLPEEPAREEIERFLNQYTETQVSFVTIGLPDFLEWMPKVGRIAKHRDIVTHETIADLRSRLIGSFVQPGILIRLVQLFPCAK
jgi:tetratricopeptide (TPR) repeat protein